MRLGLGFLQLVLTVGGFAMTLGLSGLRVTAMYLCAEEYGRQNPGGMRRAIESCLKTGALISSLAGLLLFFLSDAAAAHWIGDVRASGALRLLGIFLPVNCLCAILSGFFTACDRVRELVRVETVERVAGLLLTGGAASRRRGAGRGRGLLRDGAGKFAGMPRQHALSAAYAPKDVCAGSCSREPAPACAHVWQSSACRWR